MGAFFEIAIDAVFVLKESPAISPHTERFPAFLPYLVSLLLLVSFVNCFQSRGGTNRYGFAYKAGGHRRLIRRMNRST